MTKPPLDREYFISVAQWILDQESRLTQEDLLYIVEWVTNQENKDLDSLVDKFFGEIGAFRKECIPENSIYMNASEFMRTVKEWRKRDEILTSKDFPLERVVGFYEPMFGQYVYTSLKDIRGSRKAREILSTPEGRKQFIEG